MKLKLTLILVGLAAVGSSVLFGAGVWREIWPDVRIALRVCLDVLALLAVFLICPTLAGIKAYKKRTGKESPLKGISVWFGSL